MAARLKIGSYILDAAETGSTSTTTGVRLLAGESLEGGRPGVRYSQDRNTAQIAFVAQVVRDTTANLKTSLDALVAAVTATVHADLVLEYASGSTLASWLVSASTWSRITGRVEVDEHETNAIVLMVFTAERAGVAAGGAGDPAGAIDPVDWAFTLDANGRAGCTGTTVFKDRATAVTWVSALRGGTGRPAWMASAMRFVTPLWNHQQQLNQGSPVPDAANTPCQVTVVFSAIPAAFAGNAAFNDVVDCDYELDLVPGKAIPTRKGQPYLLVTLSGVIQLKTEADATWDPSDTTVTADNAIKAKLDACIEAMEQAAKTRRGITWTRSGEPQIKLTGKPGAFTFVVQATSDESGGLLEWQEETSIQTNPRGKVVETVKGDRHFPNKLGPQQRVRVSGSYRARSIQAVARPDFIDLSRWLEVSWVVTKPDPSRVFGGPEEVTQSWSGEWLLLADGGQGGGGAQFGAGGFDDEGYWQPSSQDV